MSAGDFIRSTALDVQTTITSLGAAIGGVAADRVGDMLISGFGGNPHGRADGLGSVGLNFLARATVCSAAYAGVATLMPDSSQNVFFTIVFFASNQSLVQDARQIALLTLGALPRPYWNRLKETSPAAKKASADCACK